jgi:site-specific DNA-methyltransferase (adenine-specific)
VGGYEVVQADILDWAANYTGPKFHALLCDPPYGLEFMGKEWDKLGAAVVGDPASVGGFQDGNGGNSYSRSRVRFGKNVKPMQEQFRFWFVALGQHLHPGAFGMAFGGSRTFHRLACAIEDAGFVIHPTIGWAFGSGFPKASRVKDASAFIGHRYGLQALKPALEFIVVFQKPYAGKPLDCITRTGAGALNIDGGRVDSGGTHACAKRAGRGGGNPASRVPFVGGVISPPHSSGRWPANFVLSEDAAARLDEQSGESKSTGGQASLGAFRNGDIYGKGRDEREKRDPGLGDFGGASRYFYRVAEQLDAADPVRYCAKASRAERDAGLEGMPVKMVHRAGHGNNEPDPKTQAFITHCRNVHPTVKPLALTRYLATLLLPPVEYAPRRILVPFAGVASECIGAMQAGWESVVGVEREADYCEIGRKRLDYYAGRRGLFARREAEPVVAQTALC